MLGVEGRQAHGIRVRPHEPRRRIVIELQTVRRDRARRVFLGRRRVPARRGKPEAVHDEHAARHLRLLESFAEEQHFLDAHRGGARHEHERHVGAAQRELDGPRALPEAPEQIV